MGMKERKELKEMLNDKYGEYMKAVTDCIDNPTAENRERLKEVDAEYNELNSKLWKDIGL